MCHHHRSGQMDKGYSWIVCFMGFLIQCVVAGQFNSAGIIFAALLDEFKANRAQTAWVTSIASGTAIAFGIVPAILGNRFGSANVIILGGVICAVGLVSSSFVGSVHPLYITYGLLWGFGQCLCFCSSLFVLPRFFEARLGLANGIVFLGAPIGSLILSLVIQELVSNVGLAKTFQILGGMHVAPVLCGIVIKLIPSPSEANQRTLDHGKQATGFDLSLFKKADYMTFVGALCLFMPAYLIPLVHLVRLARDSGASPNKAAFLVSFTAFGSIPSRPIFGKLMDHPRVNRITALQLTLLAISVSVTLVPISTKYEWLATFAFLFGFLEGCFVISMPLIVQGLVGSEKLSAALGSLFCFMGIPTVAGPSIAGWIYDSSDSYTVAFFCAGGISIISTCVLFLVPLFQTNSLPKQKQSENDIHFVESFNETTLKDTNL